MGKVMTVSASSIAFDLLKDRAGDVFEASLRLQAYLRHRVGDWPSFGPPLATERAKVFTQPGGRLPPSTTLAVGPLVEAVCLTTPDMPEPAYRLIADCGVPLDVSQSGWRPAPPHIRPNHLEIGAWAAFVGDLSLRLAPDPQAFLPCRPLDACFLDLRPQQETFGSLVPIEFGARLPFDPDIVRLPTVFIRLEILSI